MSYCLVRTADGGFSVSVFEDRAGTEESSRMTADWIRQNAPQVAGSPPEAMEGDAILEGAIAARAPEVKIVEWSHADLGR